MTDPASSSDALGSSDDETDAAFEQLLRFVVSESNKHIKVNQVARALFFFLMRAANTWQSIRTLRVHSPHDEILVVDTGALLRCMFDAYLQAAYIAFDKKKAAKRAQDYFDFEHIERFRWQSKVLKYDNRLTRRVRSLETFANVNCAVEEAYERVKYRFAEEMGKRKQDAGDSQRIRKQWYPGNLFEIAKAVGKSDEYDTLLSAFHGCVHSSASALKSSWLPVPSAEQVIMWATSIAARTARMSVDHNKIELSQLYSRILELCSRPFLALETS